MKPKHPIEDFGALFDAHTHTYFDYHDGHLSPKQLIRCTQKNRFNWVCAMAHDTAMGTKKIAKLAKEVGLPCLPGIEISTTHFHLLGYGIDHWPYRRNSVDTEDAIDELRRQDCAIFVSHPYAAPGGTDDNCWTPEMLKHMDFDGIEWCNATTYHYNKKTYEVYKNFPKGRRIAGTDAHHWSNFGYAYTQVAVNSEDPDDLIAAMKKGKCRAHVNNVPYLLAGYGAVYSILKNKFLKQKKVEGRWIKAEGDRPGSIVPEKYGPWKAYDTVTKAEKNKRNKEWLDNFLQRPVVPRSVAWLD